MGQLIAIVILIYVIVSISNFIRDANKTDEEKEGEREEDEEETSFLHYDGWFDE
jgi:Na+-transporting methylmalonyl-CoA/oxaloacetate decarboxylase gamma subunit